MKTTMGSITRTKFLELVALVSLVALALTSCASVAQAAGDPTTAPIPTKQSTQVLSPTAVVGQTETFTSSKYGYQVSYPAGWKIEVNTAVPVVTGSDPEFVTLKPDDGSNLPQIEVDVQTDVPPMKGYEDCEKNFVFRGQSACNISVPAGQIPAGELLIFQKGSANFYIRFQYEDESSLQIFNDFLASFEFIQ